MTIIYEVNLKIAQSISDEYLAWLPQHIKEMCQQKGFLSASLYHDLTSADTNSKEDSYIVQYKVASMADLQHYFDHHAAAMRQQAISLFGDQFTASRRILSPINL